MCLNHYLKNRFTTQAIQLQWERVPFWAGRSQIEYKAPYSNQNNFHCCISTCWTCCVTNYLILQMVERKQCFQSFRDSLNALEWLTTSHSYLTSCGMCKIFLLITLNCNYWSKLFISYSCYSFFLNMLWTWSSIGTNLQNLKLLQTSLPPPLPPPPPPFEIHFRHSYIVDVVVWSILWWIFACFLHLVLQSKRFMQILMSEDAEASLFVLLILENLFKASR